MRMTDSMLEEVWDLHSHNYSAREIALRTGFSNSTVDLYVGSIKRALDGEMVYISKATPIKKELLVGFCQKRNIVPRISYGEKPDEKNDAQDANDLRTTLDFIISLFTEMNSRLREIQNSMEALNKKW